MELGFFWSCFSVSKIDVIVLRNWQQLVGVFAWKKIELLAPQKKNNFPQTIGLFDQRPKAWVTLINKTYHLQDVSAHAIFLSAICELWFFPPFFRVLYTVMSRPICKYLFSVNFVFLLYQYWQKILSSRKSNGVSLPPPLSLLYCLLYFSFCLLQGTNVCSISASYPDFSSSAKEQLCISCLILASVCAQCHQIQQLCQTVHFFFY